MVPYYILLPIKRLDLVPPTERMLPLQREDLLREAVGKGQRFDGSEHRVESTLSLKDKLRSGPFLVSGSAIHTSAWRFKVTLTSSSRTKW